MCIFCDIIAGNIPSVKVYEDEKVLAILDISQTTKGHTLVMSKKHYANLSEIPEDEWADLSRIVQRLAKKITSKLQANGYNILINTNEVAGQSVIHLHVHIIPRYDANDTIKIAFEENTFDLQALAETINK